MKKKTQGRGRQQAGNGRTRGTFRSDAPVAKIPMAFVVNVTAGDIRYGKRHDPRCCPIARAVKRKLRQAVVVSSGGSVGLDREVLNNGRLLEVARWTHDAADFATAFDNGRTVSPRVVTLREYEKAEIR